MSEKTNSFVTSVRQADLFIDVEQFVLNRLSNEDDKETFLKYMRLIDLYQLAIDEGIEFDWDIAEREDWLCTRDFTHTFRYELRNVELNPKWDRQYSEMLLSGKTHKEEILAAQKEEMEKEAL